MARLVWRLLCVAALLDAQSFPKFMGRVITITTPGFKDAEQMFPKGPATLCLEGTPRQCYTAPEDFGRDPEVSVVQLDKATEAILFTAASGGVSDFPIHYALLRPGSGKELEDLFGSDPSVSAQSQYAWWSDPSISEAKIFVTADYVWGPGESPFEDHRFIISEYVSKPNWMLDGRRGYYLEDRYMTARKYDQEKTNILNSEKQEIILRLKRVKQQAPR